MNNFGYQLFFALLVLFQNGSLGTNDESGVSFDIEPRQLQNQFFRGNGGSNQNGGSSRSGFIGSGGSSSSGNTGSFASRQQGGSGSSGNSRPQSYQASREGTSPRVYGGGSTQQSTNGNASGGGGTNRNGGSNISYWQQGNSQGSQQQSYRQQPQGQGTFQGFSSGGQATGGSSNAQGSLFYSGGQRYSSGQRYSGGQRNYANSRGQTTYASPRKPQGGSGYYYQHNNQAKQPNYKYGSNPYYYPQPNYGNGQPPLPGMALAKTTYDSNGNAIVTTIVGPWPEQPNIPGYGEFILPTTQPVNPPTQSPAPTSTQSPTLTRPPTQSPSQSPKPSIASASQQQNYIGRGYSPVVPTFDYSVFTPPKTVVEIQDPTPSPTFAIPTPPPTGSVQEKKIETDSVAYETAGKIDLNTVENQFFEETQRLLTPYLGQNFGFILQNYKLTLTFVESTNTDPAEVQSGKFFVNIFEIKIRVDLKGMHDDLEPFNKDNVQSILSNFFTGENLIELMDFLNNKGIPVKVIRVYDPNQPAIVPPNTGKNTAETGSGGPNHVLLASLLCIFIVLLAGAAVFYLKRRNGHKSKSLKQIMESPMNSVYNGSEEGSIAGRGNMSASQRKQIEREKKDLEHAYDDPDIIRESLLSNQQDINNRTMKTTAEENENVSGPETRNMYFHDDAIFNENDEIQATLTSLDGNGSLNGLNQTYPEFGIFVNVQPNDEKTSEVPIT